MHDKYTEGRAEGRAEGKAEGKAETLIQMIKRKFNKSLSKDDEIYLVAKIKQASSEQLSQWVDDVLDATTLARV